MKGRTIILILLATAAIPVVVFRLSPHGGIVPFWSDETGMHSYSGGDGTSLNEAVVIIDGLKVLAKNYEIYWLWEHGVSGVDFDNFVFKRVISDGRTIDIVSVEGRDYFFDISSLKGEP